MAVIHLLQCQSAQCCNNGQGAEKIKICSAASLEWRTKGSAIGLRADFDWRLRRVSRTTKIANQARRLLAVTQIYEGGVGRAARISEVADASPSLLPFGARANSVVSPPQAFVVRLTFASAGWAAVMFLAFSRLRFASEAQLESSARFESASLPLLEASQPSPPNSTPQKA